MILPLTLLKMADYSFLDYGQYKNMGLSQKILVQQVKVGKEALSRLPIDFMEVLVLTHKIEKQFLLSMELAGLPFLAKITDT